MNKYFSSNFEDFKTQINKELKGSTSFDDFIELPFLGQHIKRYYTHEEHKSISDFSLKLSFAAQQCKSPFFNNYLWLKSNTEAIKHLSDGSYNALHITNAIDLESLDKNIDFGFIKTMFAEGSLNNNQTVLFEPKGDYTSTLALNIDELKNNNDFTDAAINLGYKAACQGAAIDTELAIALFQSYKNLKNCSSKANFILSFGADDWFTLNTKLRALPYLWYSVLGDSDINLQPCKFTLKAIESCFVYQDEYNHLLRQCMAGFTAISHGADGLVLSPYINEYLGEHASGRVASVLQNECHLSTSSDHYKGNYVLDYGAKILVDAVWQKFEALKACTNEKAEDNIIESWLENDKKEWLNDKRKFVGLNSYLSENNTELHPAFTADGQKTFR